MTAIFLTQIIALGLVGLIFAALLVTSFLESPRARTAEAALLGAAYGLTTLTVVATLASLTLPN